MNERTFDLTVPVGRQHRMLWGALGVVQIINGLLQLSLGEDLLGSLQLAFGLLILPSSFLMQRSSQYIIAFRDENLEIRRGIFKHRKIPWALISEIRIGLMTVECQVNNGRSEKINFGEMGYVENQTIKPQIISELRAFAEAKGISVRGV